ncbi:recombinase family protein [Brevibacterium sp. 50QC2O2]|uniref:recombinase family protein n=1 Tax=Brevibacterium TaxID=1696 RepID=UPI003592F414
MERLLEAGANGEISTVIVSDLARLGRRPGENMRIIDQLEEAGVTVRVADQHAPGPSGLEQRLLMLVAAEPGQRGEHPTRRH